MTNPYCYNCNSEMEVIEIGKEVLIKGAVYHADVLGCPECSMKIYANFAKNKYITNQCKTPCFDVFEN